MHCYLKFSEFCNIWDYWKRVKSCFSQVHTLHQPHRVCVCVCVCMCVCNQGSWPAARERRKQSAFFRHEWGPARVGFLCGAIKTTQQWRMPTALTIQTFLPGPLPNIQAATYFNAWRLIYTVINIINYIYIYLLLKFYLATIRVLLDVLNWRET